MNTKTLLSALAVVCIVITSCKKNASNTLPAKVDPASMAAYGFAASAPRDVEAYFANYGLKKAWKDFLQSKVMVALLANPEIQKSLGDPAGLGVLVNSDPKIGTHPLRPLLGEFFGQEVFLMIGSGGSEIFKALNQFRNDLRVAQLEMVLQRAQDPQAPPTLAPIMEVYQTYADKLRVPPLVLGGKVSSQKAALEQVLAEAEKQLPPTVALTQFQLNSTFAFKSLVLSASKLMEGKEGDVRKFLASQIPDPKGVEALFKSLGSRKLEIAYGFVGDYFLFSLGEDHSHLKLATAFNDSLIARPEMAVVAPFAHKPLFSLGWCDSKFVSICQPQFKISALYPNLQSAIVSGFPEVDSAKLAADFARIDSKAAKVFPSQIDPLVSVGYREKGLCSESFGGPKPIGSAKPLHFSAVPSEKMFLWMNGQNDPAISAATWDWIEDIASTGYGLITNVVMPKLPAQQRMALGVFQNMALPKLVELYRISRDQFAKSLGNEWAFGIDLQGEMPQLPNIPQPVREKGKLPRVGVLRQVTDSKMLAQSWESYFKLAKEIAMLVPQTSQMPGGLPGPRVQNQEGVTLSYYPLPIPMGDFLANVATTGSTWVFSTSLPFSLEITKAASKAAAGNQTPLDLSVRVNLKPASQFLEQWLAIAASNPGPASAANPMMKELAKPEVISTLIQAAQPFSDIEYRVFQENGQRRTTTRMGIGR